MTFVFFIYGDIQWGGQANIGFDAGDSITSFMVPSALTNLTLDIDEGSNVGVTGLYMYRVDLQSVRGPRNGEKSKLLVVYLITARNICVRQILVGKHHLSSKITQNDG